MQAIHHTPKLTQLLRCKSNETLLSFIRSCDTDGKYSNYLPVSWDYWHFGKHAEVANELGLKQLSLLMSAAWQMTSVFCLQKHQQKERAKELKRIRLVFQHYLRHIH